MKRGFGFFSGETLWTCPEPGLLLPLFFSPSSDFMGPLPLLTFGILPRLWSGWGRGSILPPFSGDPDSLSRARFLESDFDKSLSSLPLLPDLELDFPVPELLDFELDDLELELLFFVSDFVLPDGLLSFLDLSVSFEELTSDFFSTFVSFFSECAFRLGSLLLGSLDSGFSSPWTYCSFVKL